MHNSARGETQRKTSRVESGSIVMNSGFHLNLAAKLSSVWGPLLRDISFNWAFTPRRSFLDRRERRFLRAFSARRHHEAEREINFGDETFDAGTDVETNMESELVRLVYSSSLMRDQQKELGVSAGVSYSLFETGLSAEATLQSERLKVNVPLPTLGVFGSVALGSNWRLGADIHLFALDFDHYNGYMSYLNLGLDRKISDVIRAGIGYNFYGLRLETKDEDLRGTFRMRHYGPKPYVSMLF